MRHLVQGCRSGLVGFRERLKREEEQARTRNLVKGLQPVYYAAEAIDARLTLPVDPDVAERLSKVLETLDRFLQADQCRDEGEHIRRRLTSIRRKALKAHNSDLSAIDALS